jgi:hypothetical protein
VSQIKDTQKMRDIHQDARKKFDDIYTAVHEERKLCRDDRRFYSIAGAQWEGDLGAMFKNKPKLEANKILLAVLNIINEYRNNKITVDFVSDNDESDDMADDLDGMFRADIQDSSGDEAFDNAFEEGAGGGMGAFRLRCEYEDEDDDEYEDDENKKYQRVKFEPIFDADMSVFFDLDAKRQDKADAKHCFVISGMTQSAYMDEYDDDPVSWPKYDDSQFDWNPGNIVYIAEYYKKERVSKEIFFYRDVLGEESKYTEDEMTDELRRELESTGSQLLRTQKIKITKVRKYLMSGGHILKDCGYIAGKCIPIIPYYGKRWYIDGIERCSGHVRAARDPQRLSNMQKSKLAEISALSSVEKPIFTAEQMAGHDDTWADDNIKNYPYLLVNPIMDASGSNPLGPLGYTRSPQIPPALAALIQITENDLQDILGYAKDSEKMVSNVSGKTVNAIQSIVEKRNYIYLNNFAKTMKRAGEVWRSMATDAYVEDKRRMKKLSKDGQVDFIQINRPEIDKETGGMVYKTNLAKAKHRVSVDVGPSSSSKRQAVIEMLTGILQYLQEPEAISVVTSMIMMNMEGEGMGDVRAYFRKKLVMAGVLEPNEQELQEMQQAAQNQQPDPMQGLIQAETQKAESEAIKNRVEIAETIANTEYKKAQAVKTLAEADNLERGTPNV